MSLTKLLKITIERNFETPLKKIIQTTAEIKS